MSALIARREWGDHPDPAVGGRIPGHWVVRDATGSVVAVDKYRHDLKARVPGLAIED